MTRVFIDGAAGTTGIEIRDRLSERSEFELLVLDDAQRKNNAARRDALNAADVAILCLPDEAARDAVSLIDNRTTRVIDASTAHRVAEGWIYGFPELVGREAVGGSLRVSNPGCYPTGFLALVAPIVKAGLLPADWPFVVNAVSGYSGGGKAMIAEFEDSSGAPTAWRTYALNLAHKHLPEMQRWAGLALPPIFAPSVAPVYSGMIVDVPIQLRAVAGMPNPDAIRDVLAEAFDGSPIVRVSPHGEATLTIEHASGTDLMELFVFGNADDTQVRLVAALDNLGKGASGAAVQSLNLMTGLVETAGLRI